MSYRNFVTLLSVLDQIYQDKLRHLEKKLIDDSSLLTGRTKQDRRQESLKAVFRSLFRHATQVSSNGLAENVSSRADLCAIPH
jgi:hypothetical protein